MKKCNRVMRKVIFFFRVLLFKSLFLFIHFIGNLILMVKKNTSPLFRKIMYLILVPTFVVIVIIFTFKVQESLFLAFGVLLPFYYLALVAAFLLYFLFQVIKTIILFLKVREVKISLKGDNLIFVFGEGKKKIILLIY